MNAAVWTFDASRTPRRPPVVETPRWPQTITSGAADVSFLPRNSHVMRVYQMMLSDYSAAIPAQAVSIRTEVSWVHKMRMHVGAALFAAVVSGMLFRWTGHGESIQLVFAIVAGTASAFYFSRGPRHH
jgi:hypothetical protein